MNDLLQVVIPAALTVLVTYQGALSSTSRLRRNIKVDLDLLTALPAGHPSRPALEAHIAELLDRLIRRERRRFGSIVPARAWESVFILAISLAAGNALLWGIDAVMCPRRQCGPLTGRDLIWVNLAVVAMALMLVAMEHGWVDYALDWFLGRRQRRPDPPANR
jgi:hypothetical protein